MANTDPSEPKRTSTDEKVKQVRERAMDLIADASIHAQRIDDAARKLGLTPDLVDGLGDEIYDAAVAQLHIATKVLERSSLLADRLLDLGLPRDKATTSFQRIDVKRGKAARIDLVVRNPEERTATVHVEVECTPPLEAEVKVVIGQPELPGKRETAVEITIPSFDADVVQPLLVKLCLEFPGGRRVALPSCSYELWVRA